MSLTPPGDGSNIDTRARHATIFVPGSYPRAWALDAPNRPPVRACHWVAMSPRRLAVMDHVEHHTKPDGELI